tara:strand:+ start:36 stop:1868 length:1833 start_codon:yes stop_codon:yes gene_type:complete
MGKLLGDNTYADVTFVCNNEEIPAHKVALCTSSQLFRRLFAVGVPQEAVFSIDVLERGALADKFAEIAIPARNDMELSQVTNQDEVSSGPSSSSSSSKSVPPHSSSAAHVEGVDQSSNSCDLDSNSNDEEEECLYYSESTELNERTKEEHRLVKKKKKEEKERKEEKMKDGMSKEGEKKNDSEESDECPDEFMDPISLEVMSDPVICGDGFTYERSSIETWFEKNETSPMTGAPITSQSLIPNRALKAAIERYLEKHGGEEIKKRVAAKPMVRRAEESVAERALRQRLLRDAEEAKGHKTKVIILPPGARARITLKDTVGGFFFKRVLEFLYTGMCKIVSKADMVEETREVADLFQCEELGTICANVLEDNEFLNPSIGTYLNDLWGEKAREMFENKSLLADIIFEVGKSKEKIYGHAAIVSVRCRELAKKIPKNISPPNSSIPLPVVRVKSVNARLFLVIMRWLYSEHTPIEETGTVDVLKTAAHFRLRRLVTLCELYASKEVERKTANDIIKADISIVDILEIANASDAKQLRDFCRHFLCVNNQVYRKREDWEKMSSADAKYVDANQWPPKSYFKQLEEYEAMMGKREKKGKGKEKEKEKEEGCLIS